MHTDLHVHMSRVMAADRVRPAPRVVFPVRRRHPPPTRGRLARHVSRPARTLDSESAT